jgi:hypothetical protein
MRASLPSCPARRVSQHATLAAFTCCRQGVRAHLLLAPNGDVKAVRCSTDACSTSLKDWRRARRPTHGSQRPTEVRLAAVHGQGSCYPACHTSLPQN